MKLYVARDQDKRLWLHTDEPKRIKSHGYFAAPLRFGGNVHDCMEIDAENFPSVTWENSPQEVELNLVNINNQKDI